MIEDITKQLLIELRQEPSFQGLIRDLEQNISKVPSWNPEKPVSESTHAFYSGLREGQKNIISILKGETYERRRD